MSNRVNEHHQQVKRNSLLMIGFCLFCLFVGVYLPEKYLREKPKTPLNKPSPVQKIPTTDTIADDNSSEVAEEDQ